MAIATYFFFFARGDTLVGEDNEVITVLPHPVATTQLVLADSIHRILVAVDIEGNQLTCARALRLIIFIERMGRV